MKLSEFNYNLPEHLIAQTPSPVRTESRLMVVNRNNGTISHHQFHELPEFLSPDDLMIFNNSRVMRARLQGQKMSGGKVELFVEKILEDNHAIALIKASKAPKPGQEILLPDGTEVIVKEKNEYAYQVKFLGTKSVEQVLDELGDIPLPPYIRRDTNTQDDERYQTVYAEHLGSVAAPTAGLHFDKNILKTLKDKGILQEYLTLHVGLGTFMPVRAENVHDHKMHFEHYELSEHTANSILKAQQENSRIVSVGTTSLRCLESVAAQGRICAGGGATDLFILPGFKFKVVNSLLTNFHLPGSTLLMLICAFAGKELTMQAYQEAIKAEYRFFSYGDAMLIL